MGASCSRAPPPARPRWTSVLWDIENVPVRADQSAFAVVRALEAWLTERELWGVGVRGRISCFYNPSAYPRNTHPHKVRLDAAGVEQILAGEKSEDADRKIAARLMEDDAARPDWDVTFVIVSSDTDFCAVARQLRQRGRRVLILHDAPAASTHAETLQHAAEAFAWGEDVIGANGGAAADEPATATSEEEPPAASRRRRPRRRPRSRAALVEVGGGGGDDSPAESDDDSPAGGSPASPVGDGPDLFIEGTRYLGECCHWNRARGWGRLTCTLADGRACRIFVHRSELPAGAGEALEKGEACSFEVDWDERGRVRAVDVLLRETDAYWAG